MRAATAIAGCVWLAGWVVSLAGFKWQFLLLPSISAIFGAPTLLWLAIHAGPDFELKFGEAKSAPSSEIVSPEPKGPIDPEAYGISALNESYSSINAYARSGFRWGLFTFLLAAALTSGFIWLTASGVEKIGHTQIFPAAIFLIAPPYFISALIIFRSTLAFRRAASIHDKLLELQKTIIAIRYIEASSDAKKVIETTPTIAGLLSMQSTKEHGAASILKAS
jgi:hypothetical protein